MFPETARKLHTRRREHERTQEYHFGDVDSLLQSKPTDFTDTYLNTTSYILWNELEDFTLKEADIHLIEDWHKTSLDNEKFEEVALGVYRVKH